jgi:hypothetical protein
MLYDVGAQDVAMAPRMLLQPGDGAVRSLAVPVGVAVSDELDFEQRLDPVAQGMMDDAVGKWRRTDPAQQFSFQTHARRLLA